MKHIFRNQAFSSAQITEEERFVFELFRNRAESEKELTIPANSNIIKSDNNAGRETQQGRKLRMDFIKILSNSTRMRIMQYVQANGTVTTKQIAEHIRDVPPATLYRHINALIDAGLIVVKDERKVRGSVERLLMFDQSRINESDISDMAYQFLMGLYINFYNYGQKEGADPVKDLLMMRTATLRLTDAELMAMLTEIVNVLNKYGRISEKSEGKLRSFSTILSPTEE